MAKDKYFIFFDGYPVYSNIISNVHDHTGAVPVLNHPPHLAHARKHGIPHIDLNKVTPRQDSSHILDEIRYDQIPQGFEQSRDIINGLLNEQLKIIGKVKEVPDLQAMIFGANTRNGVRRALVEYGKRLDIPSLEIAHAHFPYSTECLKLPCHYALYGGRDQETMSEMGVRTSLLHVTGAPLFDELYDPHLRISRKEARLKAGLEPDETVILFALSYPSNRAIMPYHSMALADNFYDLASAVGSTCPNAKVLFLLHPGELNRIRVDERPQMVKQLSIFLKSIGFSTSAREIVKTTKNKLLAILSSDVVFSTSPVSTLITEVMILGRPVVALENDVLSNHIRFYSEKDRLACNSAPKISQVLGRLIEDLEYRQHVLSMQYNALPSLNYQNDGNSTDRTADLVSDFVLHPDRYGVDY